MALLCGTATVLRIFLCTSFIALVKLSHVQSANKDLAENIGHFFDQLHHSRNLKINAYSLLNSIEHNRNYAESSPQLENLNQTLPNIDCIKDLIHVFRNLNESWALRMLDANAKLQSNMLGGNLKWLGEYNECKDVEVPVSGNTTYQGKYCTVGVSLATSNVSIPLSIGVCLPPSCEKPYVKDDYVMMLKLLKPFSSLASVASVFNVTSFSCQPYSVPLPTSAYVFMCIVSIFIIFAIIGTTATVYENCHHDGEKKTDHLDEEILGQSSASSGLMNHVQRGSMSDDDDEVLIIANSTVRRAECLSRTKSFFNCFCFITNYAKLVHVENSKGQLSCLHGLRVYSMAWIILCHVYGFSANSYRNIVEAISLVDTLPFQIILNGFFSVDTFFLLSGFLLAYLFFEESAKGHKIPWVYFYVHRYLRLTPVYLIVIGFATTIYPHLGSGPFWPTYDVDPVCQRNWWYDPLYIVNFLPLKEMCLSWTWYLANDMQFFVISPLFLVLLWRWPKIGFGVLSLFLFGNWISSFEITFNYKVIAGFGDVRNMMGAENFLEMFTSFFEYYYIKPYCRIGPYLVGIALAYIVFNRRKLDDPRTSRVINLFCWTISITLSLACVFGLYHREMSLIETSFYNASCRITFACGLGWLIFACLTDQGGFVNDILSLGSLVPLSRLTYCAYLVHPLVLWGFFNSAKASLEYSHFFIVSVYLALLVISYFCAFLLSLLFEAPLIRLEKLLMKKSS